MNLILTRTRVKKVIPIDIRHDFTFFNIYVAYTTSAVNKFQRMEQI